MEMIFLAQTYEQVPMKWMSHYLYTKTIARDFLSTMKMKKMAGCSPINNNRPVLSWFPALGLSSLQLTVS
jgi:hypothetical protein